MAGCEGAVETGGGFGEFDWRQLEKTGGGADELGGDVASAAGTAHVVERETRRPFGVAGRLTARIIAYFVRRRKWVK